MSQVLTDLKRARLTEAAWSAAADDLALLYAALDAGDEPVRAALVPLARADFEGKVRDRLGGAGRPAAVVSATKPTRSLPVVGAVCGALLLGLGYSIGGGLVLAGTALFALFIFGVAVAGSRTNVDRMEERQARRDPTPTAETVPAPSPVLDAIDRAGARLLGLGPLESPP